MKISVVSIKRVKEEKEDGTTEEFSSYKCKTQSDEEVPAEVRIKACNGMFDKGDVIEIKRVTRQETLEFVKKEEE